jgi:glycosyltransferase involved in cell wall biosynthesis
MNVLTWHLHGSYLYYLSHAPHDFYVPVLPGRPEAYIGLPPGFPWPPNLHEVAADEVRGLPLDCVLFQSKRHYLEDQFAILSEAQRRLPQLYVEHDPPRAHPTDTRHVVDDPNVLLVHVTAFNRLMWDSGRTPTVVIDHGVVVPDEVRYVGDLERGLTVVNGLARRGRRLGADVFARLREEVPLDLVGMQSEEMGGLGEVGHAELPPFEARYRFFFNPIRYTSLGLAVCEAMMLGLPIVGLATTEMVTAVENGVSGFVDTEPARLADRMRDLLRDPALARRLGEGARRYARERFGIQRFARDWDRAFALAAGSPARRAAAPASTGGAA